MRNTVQGKACHLKNYFKSLLCYLSICPLVSEHLFLTQKQSGHDFNLVGSSSGYACVICCFVFCFFTALTQT